MKGIENLQAAVLLIVAFYNKGKEAVSDGVQPLQDAISLFGEFLQLPEVLEKKDEILAELKDVDSQEILTMATAVQEKLNVSNEKAKRITVKAFSALMHNYSLVEEIISPD